MGYVGEFIQSNSDTSFLGCVLFFLICALVAAHMPFGKGREE